MLQWVFQTETWSDHPRRCRGGKKKRGNRVPTLKVSFIFAAGDNCKEACLHKCRIIPLHKLSYDVSDHLLTPTLTKMKQNKTHEIDGTTHPQSRAQTRLDVDELVATWGPTPKDSLAFLFFPLFEV